MKTPIRTHEGRVAFITGAGQGLADSMSPVEALRAWLLLFVDAVATKQIIAPVLNTLVGDPKKLFEASYAQIHEALRALVRRAIKSGDIRKDLTRSTFFALLLASPTLRPAATGWQAPEGWLISLLPMRGR